jgi:hypothetical protein
METGETAVEEIHGDICEGDCVGECGRFKPVIENYGRLHDGGAFHQFSILSTYSRNNANIGRNNENTCGCIREEPIVGRRGSNQTLDIAHGIPDGKNGQTDRRFTFAVGIYTGQSARPIQGYCVKDSAVCHRKRLVGIGRCDSESYYPVFDKRGSLHKYSFIGKWSIVLVSTSKDSRVSSL